MIQVDDSGVKSNEKCSRRVRIAGPPVGAELNNLLEQLNSAILARIILWRIPKFRPLRNPTTVALGLCPAGAWREIFPDSVSSKTGF
jgi:hypothetical protein